ncbi:choice-of-anchor Q domain-containing protein [Bythopirellula goksoeyrii]|uniref:Probable pectate lyase C n=1 Tax=Bythopirellula goksoeyrii TaxID=1400387 RepID=A0A5B9Q788_9BACT|nr:choice-of-anchor Q domain-containing protein [Bythopirellula goksoeyrii]QEG34847.1 putative outer membrane protein pmp20 precursor [Bythopirellula goksoeyrii]
MALFQKTCRARQTSSFIRSPYARSLHCEQLEDRRLLALLTVTTDQDVVDFNDGVTSLREAIFAVNTVPGADEIQFDFGHDGPATILLTQGELEITDSLTITGSGAELLTIDAQQQSRIFSVNGLAGDVAFVGMTMTNGKTTLAQEGGGAISALRGMRVFIDNSILQDNSTSGFRSRGGAIISNNELQIRESIISGNFTTGLNASGGGIYATSITLVDSLVEGNRTHGNDARGGGIASLSSSQKETFFERSHIINNETVGNFSLGGGIAHWIGNLTIHDSLISGNKTSGDRASGGGVYFDHGSLSISSSSIIDNSTTGTHSRGGGLFSHGSLNTIESSTISGNSTIASGGGIYSLGNLDLFYSAVSNNSVYGMFVYGGGLALHSFSTIVNSTISGNKATGQSAAGGGIDARGSLQISNTTISENKAQGYSSRGGGVFASSLTLSHSTITGNRVVGDDSRGGGVVGIHTSIQHSIIANNEATYADSDLHWPTQSRNISFSLIGTNAGNNLTETPIGSPDANGNLIGGPIHGVIDPLLGPLADNGGPTLTHALLPGSPAINAGEPALVGWDVPAFDQRGEPFTRVFGGRIDIGAFEAQSFVVDTLVDESDGDYSPGDFSLREAIELANQIAGANTIEFDPLLTATAGPLPATILLTMGQLEITDSLTINGPGAELLTIDTSGLPGSIFEINDTISANLIDTKIAGVTLTGATDSAIHLSENLTVSETVFHNNRATQGGAIRVDNSSRRIPGINLTVHDSLFVDNHADVNSKSQGGAIYFVPWDGELSINTSSFHENSAVLHGGAIYSGTFTSVSIEQSSFENNQADYGGGISLGGNSLHSATIKNSSFLGNIATLSGGGIYSGKDLTIGDSKITGNRTLKENILSFDKHGGGGLLQLYGRLTVDNSTISGNSSKGDGGGIGAGGHSFLTNTSIFNNAAIGKGGGINIRNGLLELQTTVIVENTSGLLGGGGIYAETSLQGTSSIRNSTISNNLTHGDGGGISGINVSVANSTISGNKAFGSGGGLFIHFGYHQELAHSTVTNNISDADGDEIGSGGGLFSKNLYELNHSIIAGNFDKSNTARDVYGIVSAQFSIIGLGAEFLGPLAYNGGPTLPDGRMILTHELLPDSPAINAGLYILVPGQNGLPEFDQRGAPFARVVGSRIDIGAYESQPAAGSLNGDFDADGDVDGRDFLSWLRGYGKTGDVQQSDGDATSNHAVDGNDLAVWQATYGENQLAVSSQQLANDAAIESIANLSAGLPALFADRPISGPDVVLKDEFTVAPIPSSLKSESNLQRLVRNTQPRYSSWNCSPSDETQTTESVDLAAFDEVYAALV